MTQSLSVTGDISVLFLLGVALLLYATVQAVLRRSDYRQFILWGAAADAGLICMGLGAAGNVAMLGALLFACFQLASRGLAFTALGALTDNGASAAEALRSAGVRRPVAGWMFGLGLLAALGGTPFLAPEGRLFLMQGIVAAAPCGMLAGLLLAAACATVFIWLSVEAVRSVCLEKADVLPAESAPVPASAVACGAAVAVLGLWRTPLTGMLAGALGPDSLSHAVYMHPAFAVLYGGAFVTAALGWK
ncbi:MAG: oxidoreductase, partial [Desulfovibrionaceae bacterium]|nr:oxidoreductase [Desulfovibrionaceae bacterium]